MAGKSVAEPFKERARNAIIDFLPKDICRWYSRSRTAFQLGWKDSGLLAEATFSTPGKILKFKVPGVKNPVHVRSGSTDAETMEACLIRRYYERLNTNGPVRFIIDAGANAGYSAVFFLERYPNAVVVALEPDSENSAIAQKNLAPYGDRCHLLNLAIWPTQTRLSLSRSSRHDSTQVSEAGESGELCSSIDPMTILTMFGEDRIHIFKCDIEGAEERLFSDNADEWLCRTDGVAIEIHGRRAHEIVYDATLRHDFAAEVDHNLHYFTRRKVIE